MRVSILALTIIAAGLLTTIGLFSSSMFATTVPSAHAASRTITLTGRYATGWNGTNPGPTIRVTQGDSVVVNLISGDGSLHTFIIDVANAGITPNPNCSIDKCSSRFMSTTTFPFTADMAPGTYTYYCSIHLQSMYGSIIVQAPSNGTPDFITTSNPSMLNIAQGSTGSAMITFTSRNGFTGTVALTASTSPGGPQASLSSTSVTVPLNGSTSTTLTISTGSTGLYSTPVAQGAYIVTIAETSGSQSHSIQIPFNVGSASSGASPSTPMYGGPFSTALLIGIAIIALIVVAITALILRRRK